MNDFDSFYVFTILLPVVLLVALYFLNKGKSKDQRKAFRLVVWNLLLTLFLVSIVFAVGESYYRFFVDTTDSFALNKISQRWEKRHIRLNQNGMRDNVDYFTKIGRGKKRMTILGDSFTQGHGIKNVDDRFANILRKMNPGIEVHIVANQGDNTFREYEELQELISYDYELDVVVLAYCLNDIDLFVEETPAIYDRIHAFNNKMGFLEKNSYFINFLAFRLFAFRDPDVMNYSNFVLKGYSNKAWEAQQEVFRRLKKYVHQNNGILVVVTFPFLQEDKSEYSFREVHKTLNNFWRAEGIPHLDLLETYEPHMGKALTVNQYDAHPNEFAHRLAAEAIDRFFRNPNH